MKIIKNGIEQRFFALNEPNQVVGQKKKSHQSGLTVVKISG